MAYCTNCGNQIDQVRFCPHCGAKQQTESPVSLQSTSSYQSQTPILDPYRPAAQSAESENVTQQVPAAQFPMKWHKWLIYFVLWVHAVINTINAAAYCSYISVSGRALLFAVVYFALAAFAVYARFQLAKFRRGAPKKLLVYLLCDIACSVVVAALAGTLANSASHIGIVGAQVLWNWRYYSSRDELFVN